MEDNKERFWDLYEGFWEGKVPCWHMCHCPPMIKEECPAPKYCVLPCWEIEGTYCKLIVEGGRVSGRDLTVCQVCRVYKRYGKGKPIQLKLLGHGIDSIRRASQDETKTHLQ